MFSNFSRRQLLKLTGGLVAGGSGFLLSSTLFQKSRTKAQTPTVFVRENIATFAQSPEKIVALREGVRVMQSRPATDPTSWIYQANIHGTTDQPSRIAWNTCDHGSFFFFSWHRMYLYYFERILRQASGDDTLALPYWNYSDSADQRVLPEPFRIPADTSNPLYVSQRGAGINAGTTALAPAEVSYTAAFRRTNFFHTTTTGQSFGSRRVSQTTHRGSGKGELERRPHDQVHVVVGGSTGWMRDVNLAARDPIFWLHHANIDRLWKRWLQQGGGRANPTGNSDWMNDRFTFFDADGTQVTLRGRDIIDTVGQLNYRYDDDPSSARSSSRDGATDQASQRTVANPQTLAATSISGELREAPVTLPLPVMEEAGPGPRRQEPGSRPLTGAASEERPILLNVEGIDYNLRNSIPYEIYINLPKGFAPDRNSPYYAGRLALFALPQRATFSIAVTNVVRELQQRNLMTGNSISVTLVPPPEEVAELQRTGRSIQGLQGAVRFRRVTITRE